ncbi:MAG: tetratricopeptide repeat-containing sulfotransferase family protein [Rhodanobacteraceae bacterium]
MHAGSLVEAERLCSDSLECAPDNSDVLLLLALSLQQQGRHNEAIEIYARLTRLNPESGLHWGNYVSALSTNADLEKAEQACREALRAAPDNPDLLDKLGVLQLRRRDPTGARDSLLRAFGKAPNSPEIRIHAARACVECRDYRSDDLTRPWREWLPLENSLQYELADLKIQSGDAPVALELLEDLLSREPSDLPVRLLLANVYERVNRIADSEALLNNIVATSVDLDGDAENEIAHQRAQLAHRKGDHAEARSILERINPRTDLDYVHYRSLAIVCDKMGDTAAAMTAMHTAHLRQIEELRIVAPHRVEEGAPVLPAAVGRVTPDDFRSWPQLRAPDQKESPIFIVGMPRSGTTLLEQMLDAHPHLQSMDERPFFNILSSQLDNFDVRVPQDLGRLGQRDCDELRKGYLILACSKVPRRWDAQLVDKNPLNMLWVPMIHRLYPQAKFILALRHPCDVILSCYMQNFRSAVLAAASQSLERLAQAYLTAMECWLYHVDLIKPDVFVSRYEDLVADTPGQTRRIAEFLELGDAESMLHFDVRAREKGYIATPSYTQVIEPINSKGLNRWHRYREYFEPVLPILRPMLEHWNYAAD